jgi:hypothetical protein
MTALLATHWLAQAACRGRPTAWWFSPAGSLEQAMALALCKQCPVRADCLQDAERSEQLDAPDLRDGIPITLLCYAGRVGGRLAIYSIRRPEIALLMTSCCISLVPSKIVWILASRCQRSTGYSRV